MKIKNIIALALISLTLLSSCSPEAEPVSTGGAQSDVVLYAGGKAVNMEEYRYHLLSVMDTYEYYIGDFIDWDSEIDGMQPAEYFKEQALDNILRFKSVYLCAEEYGIEFDEQTDSDVDATIAEQIENAGGEEAFDRLLEQQGISREFYRYMIVTPDLYYKVLLNLYDNGGRYAPAEETVRLYFDEYFLATKHVAVLLYDEEGNSLEGETLQAKENLIRQAHDEYLADGDFESLLIKYNEDTVVNDEVLHFTYGSLPDIYYSVAEQLEIGGVSDIIEVGQTMCFIKRYELEDSFYDENYDALEEEHIIHEFGLLLDRYIAAFDVEYTDLQDTIDPYEIYKEYLGY